MRALLPALLLTAVFALPSVASANRGGSLSDGAEEPARRTLQLRPSARYTLSAADDAREHGFGLDLELRVFPGASAFRYGAFVSGDVLLDGSERFAGGLVGGFGPFAVQIGVAQRTAADGFAASTGLHLAKTFTFGPVGLAFRMTVPLAHQGDQGLRERSFERAFQISLGWSIDVVGSRAQRAHSCGGAHGHGGSL